MGIRKKVTIVLALAFSPSIYAEDTTVNELGCLAKNIYFEARNQPWVGQVAIAQVTMNRVKSNIFPNNVCDVVKQQKRKVCQFSWYCDGKSDQPKDERDYRKAMKVAIQVYSGTIPDVTEGAFWYHANYINKPFWAYSYKEKVRINEHIFYSK